MGGASESQFDRLLRAISSGFVVLFGIWTIVANFVVLSDRGFRDLISLAPFVLVVAVIALVYLNRINSSDALEEPEGSGRSNEGGQGEIALARFLIGAAISAVFAFGSNYVLFWGLAVLFLGFSFIRQIHAPLLSYRTPAIGGWNRPSFVFAMIIAVLAVVVLNRPNPDQTLGINMAVSVMDDPSAPIFASDTLHGIDGAYFYPTYRVHTFELLAATVANALGVTEPIVVFQLILPPLLAIVSVVAAARFFRLFIPRWWGWATFVLVLSLILMRETYTMYGNLAYLRLFEGKSIFLTAAVPLLGVYAVDFFIRPRVDGWLLLMLAQAAAVGLTANALYVAPIVAALALAACWRPTRRATARLGAGLTASIYPLVMSLVIRSTILREGLRTGLEDFRELIPIEEAARSVLGDNFTLWLWLLAIVSAWGLVKNRAARHWMLGYGLAFTVLFLNPFLDVFWGFKVTAPYLTWRLLWAIPLPLFLAVMVVEGLSNGFRTGLAKSSVSAAVAIALALTFVIDKPWSEWWVTTVDPGLKVPPEQYEVAAKLVEIGGKGGNVLAPEDVSVWVPTFRDHAYPLVARAHYTEGVLSVFADQIDTQDLQERLLLHELMSGNGNPDQGLRLLEVWIAEGKISAVAIHTNHPEFDSLSAILGEAEYTGVELHDYMIFSLKDASYRD